MQLLNDVPLLPSTWAWVWAWARDWACPHRVVSAHIVFAAGRDRTAYTLNRVLSAAKCCSANWLRILIYIIKCGTDFALKSHSKTVPECFSLHKYNIYLELYPIQWNLKHLCLLPHTNPAAMIYAFLQCATLLKGHNTPVCCLCVCLCVHVNLSTWVWIWYGQLPQYVT